MSERHRAGVRQDGSDPFDLWLKQHLHQRHNPVLEREVPGDLLRLVCDSYSEWDEMKERWTKPVEDANSSLS